MDNNIIITFDVSGTVYRVYQSLLAQYPTTILYKKAFEYITTTNIKTSSLTSPIIFIDGNNERFQYVLDYMRNDQRNDIQKNQNTMIILPYHINKEMFLYDLQCYNFENILHHNVDHIIQKNIRDERITLIVSRCIGYLSTTISTTTLNDDTPPEKSIIRNNNKHIIHRCKIIPNHNTIEIGLYILWDNTHKEHIMYRSTIDTMFMEYNMNLIAIRRMKGHINGYGIDFYKL